jgi:hypothetical protein
MIAIAPPSIEAFEFMVIDVAAIKVPAKLLPLSNVAEVATCHQTRHGCAPPVIFTCEPIPVVNAVSTRKYQASSGEPVPANVNVPFKSADRDLYVPGAKTLSPRFPVNITAPDKLAMLLYATRASFCAEIAAVLLNCTPV